MPQGEIQLQEPPVLPEAQGAMSGVISYLPMALSSLGMVLIFLRPGSGGGVLMYVAIGLMAVSAIGMLLTQMVKSSGDRKRQLRSDRRDYLRYLSQTRRQVRRQIVEQHSAQLWRHPPPDALWSVARTSRLWERRVRHEDFGDVRIAVGDQKFAVAMVAPATKPVEDLEPLSAHALRRFIRAYGQVEDQPVAAYLRAYAKVLLRGEPDDVRGMARAILGQLTVFHSPEELRVVVVCDRDRQALWEWAKWLPHALHPVETDGAGPLRLLAHSVTELDQIVGEEFGGRGPFEPDSQPSRDEPYVVVVLDSEHPATTSRLAERGYRNTTVIDLTGSLEWTAAPGVLRLRISDAGLEMLTTGRDQKEDTVLLGRADQLGQHQAATLARSIAPLRLGGSPDNAEPMAGDFELSTMLGITDLRSHDIASLWTRRSAAKRLRVPLGVSADGSPVELDIKESAQGGMGPHGMLIGATGSGKSELLRTLVLALALTHSSETLNFVLVDFKGGATFLGLDRLPHTSAVITNLADEQALVGRMREALHGELVRRQELLRAAGNYSSLLEYETARAAGTALAPLPTLFVVVDEFSELLAAHREFMDLFIMIGRLGRSLGVHLLLASQRLDEGRMHQLESHLSYRIGLRTFSAMESRGVLGVPDAYQLPSQPGNGFLRSDIATLTRFKAAYVSGDYNPGRRKVEQAVVAGQIVPYLADYVAAKVPPVPDPVEEAEPETAVERTSQLQVAVDRLSDAGPPAHQVWLPPLDVSPHVAELVGPLAPVEGRGLCTVDWRTRRRLAVPIGIVDRPFQQLRDPLVADLGGAGGHVGIAGGPQSGKSTLLCDLITAIALTNTPVEVQFYGMDFGGGMLSSLAGLPHVGTVTGRLDVERVGRMINEIGALIARREQQFAQLGIDSMATFRQRRAAGELPDERFGDVFLVVDGWSTVRQDFTELMPELTLIAGRGLNYGVHLIIATARWSELPAGLRDQLATRFELRLGDAVESSINMRAAEAVPRVPGRGLTEDQSHFLAAVPCLNAPVAGREGERNVGAGLAELVAAVAEHWTGERAPAVRMLPTSVHLATLPEPLPLRLPLGIEDRELAPLWHDFTASPHLVVVGDAESGKTNLLSTVVAGITGAYQPDQAKIMLVDYRRGLYDLVPEAYRLGYAVAVDVARQLVDGVLRAMERRRPGADITPAQLRERSWWTGPELFVVVDDYDLVAGSQGNTPFLGLLDLLAQGAELGMHLVVARSANGVGRALATEPLLRRLQEVNAASVLLSCPPSEGQLFDGLKPRILPPGRGRYVTRRRTMQFQTALATPSQTPDLALSG